MPCRSLECHLLVIYLFKRSECSQRCANEEVDRLWYVLVLEVELRADGLVIVNWCLFVRRIAIRHSRKGPPRFLTEGRMSMTKSGLLVFIVSIVFSCLGLLSYIELCIFLCRLVLFVTTLAKWLAGKTYSRDIFRVKGFPLQRPDWRVTYCSGILYVFPTRNIVSILINFTF